MAKDDVMMHLDHVDYPASKQELIEACNNMDDVTDEDRKWFMENLPARTFKNADEVREALGKIA